AAGLYYLQEPTAMMPASLLPVPPQDLVLDVCAAPGGKSTALSAKHPRLLVSNDISVSRSRALLRNLELFGADNALILSESPNRLSARFPEIFDKILIDAPCSGEGMFRKDSHAVSGWLEHGHGFFTDLQRSITKSCLEMLKPGGMLLYSTCTFSREEDEEIVSYMKGLDPSLQVLPVPRFEGFSAGIEGPGQEHLSDDDRRNLVRIFPHKAKGEGHFAALLRKGSGKEETRAPERLLLAEMTGFPALPEEAREFLLHVRKSFPKGVFTRREERLMLEPEDAPEVQGLRVLRNGLYLGDCLKNRFEPSQTLAMTLSRETFDHTLDFDPKSEEVRRFLRGEAPSVPQELVSDGWSLVTVSGFPLGFVKKAGGRLKNQLPPSWRMAL
ncbi:MAG: RsmF rRNA methyltransferase first C-terminal domain-containing protein, partial [Lachnospiraceae bacterium]|nr:RsmF rRNA methyltransferase first C-terminal domain-containing protein [Lachnospiraceae bacterium]